MWHVYLPTGEHVFSDGAGAPLTHQLSSTRTVWTAGGKRAYALEHGDYLGVLPAFPRASKAVETGGPIFETKAEVIFDALPTVGPIRGLDRLVRGQRL